MAHHAYYLTGDLEAGVEAALGFIELELGLKRTGNPDVSVLRFATFTIDDARRLIDFDRQAPVEGDKKALIVSAPRLYSEAQNALLKLFEEPNEGTTLFLVVPSEGVLLSTLISRMVPLVETGKRDTTRAQEFLALSHDERRAYTEKLLNRAKDDKADEKQRARLEALQLVQELTAEIYKRPVSEHEQKMKTLLLKDLSSFTEILHERSASLKLIFEHLLMVLPDPKRVPSLHV